MAITIRNKQTEAMIRKLGERRNEGPSAVISRLAKAELKREKEGEEANCERRLKGWDKLMALTPPRDPNLTWEDIEREMDSLFDYLDDEGKKPS